MFVRGVTYGPFAPDEAGCEYHTPARARTDLLAIRAAGFNAVRLYTVPPRWLLDEVASAGLRAMIGLPWEQHVAFLDGGRGRRIRAEVAQAVASCAGHPAVYAYAIGNEIPAPIVRWYGHRRVERYLRELYETAKDRDPDALVTYVNYPSTEYLDLPFLDFTAFNLYLERQAEMRSYVGRLHNIAGDRPLMIAELGMDALRNGDVAHADLLASQTRLIARDAGCAGLFVFAWTDEWHRGGQEITDWGFGLTTRDRRPRPALAAVRAAFEAASAHDDSGVSAANACSHSPGISVVVCTYNGSRTIGQCLDALHALDYPRYEVIVVDDGSTDDTHAVVAAREGVRLIRTDNRGLSAARNTGWQAARHPLVAYIDDDAWPEPDWLTHLSRTFAADPNHAGVGGPNIPPEGAGLVADAVAAAPGGPIHVLLTDDVAEHIPGCNMAFRRDRLEAVGGFDPQFRIAGDDVDLCWRMQERGWTLGFHPAAMVWHRRRDRVRTYLRQQLNYGRAEADLERKWPEKYNAVGHLTWSGRMYQHGLIRALGWWSRRRIYHGIWGSALFQSVYHAPPSWLWAVPTLPEWYMLAIVLALISLAGVAWAPLAWTLPLLSIAVFASAAHAVVAARRSLASHPSRGRGRRVRLLGLTTFLHFVQPVVRLCGRLDRGLTPWRRHGATAGFTMPIPRTEVIWSEPPAAWAEAAQRIASLRDRLAGHGSIVLCGGDFDRWDVEARGGLLASARVRVLTEEHGRGRQLVRHRIWPRVSPWVGITSVGALALAAAAALMGGWTVAVTLAVPAALMIARAAYESGSAMASVILAVREEPEAGVARGPQTSALSPIRKEPPVTDSKIWDDLGELEHATVRSVIP